MNHKVNEIEQNLDNSLSTDVGIDEKDELNFHSKGKGIEEEEKKIIISQIILKIN